MCVNEDLYNKHLSLKITKLESVKMLHMFVLKQLCLVVVVFVTFFQSYFWYSFFGECWMLEMSTKSHWINAEANCISENLCSLKFY